MANIVYGIAGEGRGHAIRAHAIIDQLRRRHHVFVCTHDLGYQLFRESRLGEDLTVERIPGLGFRYGRAGKLSYPSTVRHALPYLAALGRNVSCVSSLLEEVGADLVVTDFEPLTARAAVRCGVPLVSVDHQHLLTIGDFSSYPWRLRARIAFMQPAIRAYCSGQVETVVSSFAFPPLRDGVKNTRCIGVPIRLELAKRTPRVGDHLVFYARRRVPPNVIESLRQCGHPVHVYGLGRRSGDGRVQYHEISHLGFIDHLASCCALITTAGNQLVGEALSLRKPVLALPEPGNFEQEINGHLLEGTGAGQSVPASRMSANLVGGFLERIEEYRDKIQVPVQTPSEIAGAVICSHIGDKESVTPGVHGAAATASTSQTPA